MYIEQLAAKDTKIEELEKKVASTTKLKDWFEKQFKKKDEAEINHLQAKLAEQKKKSKSKDATINQYRDYIDSWSRALAGDDTVTESTINESPIGHQTRKSQNGETEVETIYGVKSNPHGETFILKFCLPQRDAN
jgi:predicted RNase H-like nuclease (RuvC/YqgF family)